MPALALAIASQREWTKLLQLAVDRQGYLENLADNLLQPLSVVASLGYANGSG